MFQRNLGLVRGLAMKILNFANQFGYIPNFKIQKDTRYILKIKILVEGWRGFPTRTIPAAWKVWGQKTSLFYYIICARNWPLIFRIYWNPKNAVWQPIFTNWISNMTDSLYFCRMAPYWALSEKSNNHRLVKG